MSRLIILIALGVVGWLIYKLYFQKLRQQGKPGMMKLGLIALGLAFIALAVSGRAHVAFALIGAAMTQIVRIMPLLIRFFPAFQQMFNSNRIFGDSGSKNQRSTIKTKMLSISLEHDSGQIDGQVTDGTFKGKTLSELTREDIQALYQECTQRDPEGVRLLQAFISRRFGDQGDDQSDKTQADYTNSVTSSHEAREILGVGEDATREDIIASHRRLMGKLHPDKGGSTYLATKINAAKEVLVSELKRKNH